MRRLAPRQKSFVAGYVAHGRAKEAARDAGYADPARAARRLLANPAVRRELGLPEAEPPAGGAEGEQCPLPRRQGRRLRPGRPAPEETEAANPDGKVKPGTVIQGLLAEARRQGPGTTHSARVRAWTELGRHLGMFSEQGNSDGDQVEVIYLAPEQYRSVEEWQEANRKESDPKPDRKPN
jgi:hypothetical protein